ncbi:MAG TPA: antitoxin family protein [Humisphaera sp.]
MTKNVDAIYESGVLKPVEPIEGLAEHDRVNVTINSVATRSHPLDGWVGGVSDEDAATMMRVIEEEFERIDPDDWK